MIPGLPQLGLLLFVSVLVAILILGVRSRAEHYAAAAPPFHLALSKENAWHNVCSRLRTHIWHSIGIPSCVRLDIRDSLEHMLKAG